MKQKMFSDIAFSFENLVAVHKNDSWKLIFLLICVVFFKIVW